MENSNLVQVFELLFPYSKQCLNKETERFEVMRVSQPHLSSDVINNLLPCVTSGFMEYTAEQPSHKLQINYEPLRMFQDW